MSKSEIERLQAENWALRQALTAIKGSMSWRITAPLRAFSRPFAHVIAKFTYQIPQKPEEAHAPADALTAAAPVAASAREFVPFAELPRKDMRVRNIAFYLPQFHPIPENDKNWGRGFTEWNNVIAGRPRYAGHYQPRIPGELGYYDLRVPEVMQRQVELARNYGVSGFCFHYYWFSGHRLLERPLDAFLANPDLDIEFCLCWANENWTRRWDGLDHDILIGQEYSERDSETFIPDIARYFADPRYMRVDGKPLLVIYRLQDVPDARRWLRRLRDSARKAGLPGLYVVGARTNGFTDDLALLCDACVEFPPHQLNVTPCWEKITLTDPSFSGQVYSYAELVDEQLARKPACPVPLYRTAFPGWDNEARRRGRGHSFAGATPELYARWIGELNRDAERRLPEDRRFVFVNAWNEWSEGAHLEPDARSGYAFLQATYEALPGTVASTPVGSPAREVRDRAPRVAAVVHLFYPDLWDEVAGYLDNLPRGATIVVTYCSEDPQVPDRVLQRFPQSRLVKTANRGRDMLPFLIAVEREIAGRHDLVCKIHTKKSVHRIDGDVWRSDLFSKLLGSAGHVQKVLHSFEADRRLGMLIPEGHYIDGREYWGSNEQTVYRLAERLGMAREAFARFRFCGGSMFWIRSDVLDGLMKLNLGVFDFEQEAGQVDGTMAHALERLIAPYCLHRGYSVAEISARGELEHAATTGAYRFVD